MITDIQTPFHMCSDALGLHTFLPYTETMESCSSSHLSADTAGKTFTLCCCALQFTVVPFRLSLTN